MINWLLESYQIEIGATPDDYLNHLMIEEDKTNIPQFYPIEDRLYYCCAYALERSQELRKEQCKCCPFSLVNNNRLYNENSCDYWCDLPHDVKWVRHNSKDLSQWKKLMREFRDKKWGETWIPKN